MRTISYIVISVLGAASAACIHHTDEETLHDQQRRAQTKQRADELVRRYEALEATKGQNPTASAGSCDAATLADRGGDEALRGQYGEALRLYEASLTCQFEPEVARQAFFAACHVKDSARARVHFEQFSNDPRRELLREACESYGVDL